MAMALRNGIGPEASNSTHRLTTNQFHGDVVRAIHVPEFINGDDVGVIERARGTGFLLKARQGFRLRMAVQRNRLDGDLTAEASVFGAINFAHAAGAELLKNFVSAEARARRQAGRN